MPTNREIAEAFGAAFDPPLAVIQTHAVDGRPVQDTWIAAESTRAVTAIATGDGALHLYFDRPDAAALGRLVASMSGSA